MKRSLGRVQEARESRERRARDARIDRNRRATAAALDLQLRATAAKMEHGNAGRGEKDLLVHDWLICELDEIRNSSIIEQHSQFDGCQQVILEIRFADEYASKVLEAFNAARKSLFRSRKECPAQKKLEDKVRAHREHVRKAARTPNVVIQEHHGGFSGGNDEKEMQAKKFAIAGH